MQACVTWDKAVQMHVAAHVCAWSGDGESWYDGWSCFKHMRDKRDPPLVLTQGRGPMKCWLTPAVRMQL